MVACDNSRWPVSPDDITKLYALLEAISQSQTGVFLYYLLSNSTNFIVIIDL